MKVRSQGELDDLKGILELHNDFFTIEPFLPSEYDIRLQYLGGHVRAYVIFERNIDYGPHSNNSLEHTQIQTRDRE